MVDDRDKRIREAFTGWWNKRMFDKIVPPTLDEAFEAGCSASSSPPASDGMDARELAWNIVNGLYYCDRVWSAWQVGTMTEDDFSPAEDVDEVVSEATALIAKHDQDVLERCAERAEVFYRNDCGGCGEFENIHRGCIGAIESGNPALTKHAYGCSHIKELHTALKEAK